jgi:hypothetical protein
MAVVCPVPKRFWPRSPRAPALESIRTASETVCSVWDSPLNRIETRYWLRHRRAAPLQFRLNQDNFRQFDKAIERVAREQYPEIEHSRDVGAYLGLTPRRRQSGDIDQQLRISKAGNRRLRSLLVQCAQYLLGRFGPDTDLKRWGARMAQRGGKNPKKRAIIAVARKLAFLLHRLWVTGDTYPPLYNAIGCSVGSAVPQAG